MHWTVINGINNPIISTAPVTLTVNAMGVPATGAGAAPLTVPANASVIGNSLGFSSGRVYAPSATSFDPFDITVIFAGYHTQKPKNGLEDYRTMGASACVLPNLFRLEVSTPTMGIMIVIPMGITRNWNKA